MDRLHQKSRKHKNNTGTISTATAQAIVAVAADRNRKHYLSQSGLITLERSKPRRLPTVAERQFAMNENLRRFLSSLPEFPLPPEDLEMDEERVNETTIEQDEDSDSRPVAEGKNILFEAKSGSQPNLNSHSDDYEQENIKNSKVCFDLLFGKITFISAIEPLEFLSRLCSRIRLTPSKT